MKKVEYQKNGKEKFSVHMFDLLTIKNAAFPIRIPLGVYIEIERLEILAVEEPKLLTQYITYEDSEMIRFLKESLKELVIYESEFKGYTEEEKNIYTYKVISRLQKSKIGNHLQKEIVQIQVDDLEPLPKIEYPMMTLEDAEKIVQVTSTYAALKIAEEKQKKMSLHL
ncbi:MAG: hypothetical protein PHN72_06080 [Bacilli bacterium]|nr:hypothetical protein [Bacilli bacterium]